MGRRKREISHFIFGERVLALAEGLLVAGVTAAAMGSVLISGDRGAVSQLASLFATLWGAVALPAVAAPADIKGLPATVKPARALPQQDRWIGSSLQRHASPGRLDNGKPSVSVSRSNNYW
jgi:hypothetical protein